MALGDSVELVELVDELAMGVSLADGVGTLLLAGGDDEVTMLLEAEIDEDVATACGVEVAPASKLWLGDGVGVDDEELDENSDEGARVDEVEDAIDKGVDADGVGDSLEEELKLEIGCAPETKRPVHTWLAVMLGFKVFFR